MKFLYVVSCKNLQSPQFQGSGQKKKSRPRLEFAPCARPSCQDAFPSGSPFAVTGVLSCTHADTHTPAPFVSRFPFTFSSDS